MDKEAKCVLAEQVGEVFIGATIATCVEKVVFPHCNPAEKLVVGVGTMIGSWMVGRAWAKQFYKFCDAAFDTDFEDVTEQL